MINPFTPRFAPIRVDMEGFLPALAPLPFLLLCTWNTALPPTWALVLATLSSLTCLTAGLLLHQRMPLAKGLVLFFIVGCGLVCWPYYAASPLQSLLAAVLVILASHLTLEYQVQRSPAQVTGPADHRLQRARGALWVLPLLVTLALVIHPQWRVAEQGCLLFSTLVSQYFSTRWIWLHHKGPARWLHTIIPLFAVVASGLSLVIGGLELIVFSVSLASLLSLPKNDQAREHRERWWEPLLNHPARVLISTFLGLCLLGTLLLQLPWATENGSISLLDAAFTAVSAVCVTGLGVVDTRTCFTPFGHSLLLVLIQLGGLGIMTITTVALHVLGRRLSLRQERLLTSMTETSNKDLMESLLIIVRFTLIMELLGALGLGTLFALDGESPGLAFWRGLFTAVSAFCNAGFALQSDSLIGYQHQPLVLHMVAILIITGGLAPATCLLIPQWLKGKTIPLGSRIALITTAILLLFSTLSLLALEWDNTLAGMAFADKCHNAWFQAVTLRTAGFNSIDLTSIRGPSFLIMLGCMFIGGSPGGTAGGLKTTTIAVVVMTFWTGVTGKDQIIAYNRRVPGNVLIKAVTIMGSGILVWFFMVLALELTQELSGRQMVFEVTSALATVGLSLDTTPHLDGMGKIIIMLAMFIGRIGPTSLFTLLSGPVSTDAHYPDAQLTLT